MGVSKGKGKAAPSGDEQQMCSPGLCRARLPSGFRWLGCCIFNGSPASPFRLRRRVGRHPSSVDAMVETEGADPFWRARAEVEAVAFGVSLHMS